MAIEADSAEYEYITEAIELSKDVQGICAEIGLRRGYGTKTIIDALFAKGMNKPVIAIDPYGNIEYEHRENIICRLDYTNKMKKECLTDIYAYIIDKPIDFQFFSMTDTAFFKLFKEGVPFYDQEEVLINKYAFVHLDGPHGGEAIISEIEFFKDRMDKGATLIIDDVSPDFLDMEPVEHYLLSVGFTRIKIGGKKAIYQKK